jgi:hypothetical protein
MFVVINVNIVKSTGPITSTSPSYCSLYKHRTIDWTTPEVVRDILESKHIDLEGLAVASNGFRISAFASYKNFIKP